MKQWLYDNRYGLIVALVAAIILLPFLGAVPLMDPDEPVYGETAREMLAAGDWLSPRIFGNYWYDKPPFFYWLEMISYSLFGATDFASRLPSALAAMATTIYVYAAGRDIFNKPIAALSALLLVTSFGFMYIGKAAVTDMTLVLTLTVAMMSFYRKKYYTAYLFCGLSLLVKGPVGYAFPALIMLIYIAWTRQWTLLKEMKIPQGILLAFAVGLPWYVLMYKVHGEVFLDTFIGYHNLTRFAAPEHPGQNSLVFFIPVLLAAMMPWTIYLAPMFPPTAYLIGWYWYRSYIERSFPRALLAASYVLGLLLLACNALPLSPGAEFFRPAIVWVSIGLAAALFLPTYFLWHRRFRASFIVTAVTMICFSWGIFGHVIPHLKSYVTSYDTAQILPDVYDGHSQLYVEKFLRPGVTYYSGMYGEEWDPVKNPELESLLTQNDKIFLIMTKATFHKLARSKPLIDHFGIAGETPSQVILINHP